MAQHSNTSTQEEKEALLIDFGAVPQTARYFINLTLLESKEGLRLYGIRSTLARRLMRIGYEIIPAVLRTRKVVEILAAKNVEILTASSCSTKRPFSSKCAKTQSGQQLQVSACGDDARCSRKPTPVNSSTVLTARLHAAITEGKRLDYRCRVRLVRNGFFTRVEELLPSKSQQEEL